MEIGRLLAALVVLAVACGEAEPAATSTTEPEPTASIATTTTTTSVVATTVEPATTTTVSPVDVEISGGVASGAAVFTFELGESVDITVVSDVDDELHVHGYDLVFELTAGVPLILDFVADVPGVFEVEVHTGHSHVFDIEVVG
ncbi:MAG TPA: hypothetical protein VFT85_03950 [Acidimicrobiia bacterium]|nr:hypothetical protein [Acidimicrobiia bacterium]